ncbi:primosomal protein N' [Ningiella sp. W23]|uniref:primosomal protein N' n=1 Tax=Ningiella sp. W23 TaxID=3023715 RepID=UPI00375636D8
MCYLKVAVPVPLRKSFDYLVQPNDDRDNYKLVGCRVSVPFGNRQLIGIVLAVSDDLPPEHQLKSVSAILDSKPIFNFQMMNLGKWIADYYLHPIGEVFGAMMPTALRKGVKSERSALKYLQRDFDDLSALETSLKQSKKQLQLCALLASHDLPLLEAKKQFSQSVIRGVLEKQLAVEVEKPYEALLLWQRRIDIAPALQANVEQNIAISAIDHASSFQSFLIEGVTGSGKTEVYLQVIEKIISRTKQVLILVPEIGLTPQTVKRFEQRFGPIVAAVHSGLNDSERLRIWQQASDGELGIIIGTRSSVFLPLPSLGMIIVDEEHDDSFKQQDKLKYHARDIAVYRARQLDIPLVMGSATPSLESLHNAFSKKYHHLQLTQRAANASMPVQILLDIKDQALEYGIAKGLLEKVAMQLRLGNQVLIFVHRRGYAPAILCHKCGYVESCQACDNPYTLHQVTRNIQCHRCGDIQPIPRTCKACSSTQFETFGYGTEQIEEGLKRLFPEYSSVRIDSDSTRGKGRLSDLLAQINNNDHQILIGTQILSKGHHFPNVTLAIILNVDGSLFSADFRAPEKLGQLITQLSGRAGRANKNGEVWLQTHHPSHPLLQDLVQNGFADYARSLLLERKHVGLPPYEHQILLRCEAADLSHIEEFLGFAHATIVQFTKLKLIGPLPCAIEKKQARFRMMLIAQSASRVYLQRAMQSALDVLHTHRLASRVRWSVDVAPSDFS